MTEEILFADIINHYGLKINEINDLLTDSVKKINSCNLIMADTWKSGAAAGFYSKMGDLIKDFKTADDLIDRLSVLFAAVKDSELTAEADRAIEITENITSDN